MPVCYRRRRRPRRTPSPQPTPPSSARTSTCSTRTCRRPTSRRPPGDIFAKMEANQFGSERYALLFKPGKYNVTFNVGFYTHVAGLGRNPDDVQIDGGLTVNAEWCPTPRPCATFGGRWRTLPSRRQATQRHHADRRFPGRAPAAAAREGRTAPVRLRSRVERRLCQRRVPGRLGRGRQGVPASQQQWLSRNSKWGKLDQRRVEHGLRGLREYPGRHVPQAALHGRGPNARDPRKALPLYRRLRQVLRLRAGAADQHPGRHLGQGPHARQVHFPRPVLYRSARQGHAPPRSTPPWPRASTSSSRRAFTCSTTR